MPLEEADVASLTSAILSHGADISERILALSASGIGQDRLLSTLAETAPSLRVAAAAIRNWPEELADQIAVLVRDATSDPFAPDLLFVDRTRRKHGWNWLVTPQDVAQWGDMRDACGLLTSMLHDALATQDAAVVGEVAKYADLLGPRATGAALAACLLTVPADNATCDAFGRRMQALLEDGAVLPAAHLSLYASRKAFDNASMPPSEWRSSLATGVSDAAMDLLLASAITGLANSTVLASDLTSRLDAGVAGRLLLRHTLASIRWLVLIRSLLALRPELAVSRIAAASLAADPFLPARRALDTNWLIRVLASMEEAGAARDETPVASVAIAAVLRRVRERTQMPDAVRAPEPATSDAVKWARLFTPRELRRYLSGREHRATTPPTLGSSGADRSLLTGGARAPDRATLAGANVSVCILNHNGTRATLRLLASLAREWRDWPYEILLLDNGSEPDEVEYLKARLARVADERLRFFRVDSNLGVGPARNALFESAKGPWIISLDNDMIALPQDVHNLEACVAASSASFFNLAYEEFRTPGVAGLGKSWSIVDQDGEKRFRTGYVTFGGRNGADATARVAENRLSGGACLFERDAFFEAGGFPEGMQVGFEDYAFSLTLRERGQSVETPALPFFVHAHLAPRHLSEVDALVSRFDREKLATSQLSFGSRLKDEFSARYSPESDSRPLGALPVRFDLRHAVGAPFFLPRRIDGLDLAIVTRTGDVDEAILDVATRGDVNCDTFVASEFPDAERAQMALGVYDIVIDCAQLPEAEPTGAAVDFEGHRPIVMALSADGSARRENWNGAAHEFFADADSLAARLAALIGAGDDVRAQAALSSSDI